MEQVYLGIVLAPLFGAVIAGLFGKYIGRSGSHWVTIAGVAVSFVLSLLVFKQIIIDGATPFNGAIYTWMSGRRPSTDMPSSTAALGRTVHTIE